MGSMRGPAVKRFINKVRVCEDTKCWLWTAGLHHKGYAKFRDDDGRKVFAHRWAYEWFRGPIPEGLQIDHLCRVRHCVNPWHMEPVTGRENQQRGLKNQFTSWTHCAKGHPLSGDNLHITKKGYRRCLECNRQQCREYYHRRKAKEAAKAAPKAILD